MTLSFWVYTGKKIIVCNGDIYFDTSLRLVNERSLCNTFICLTRWNVVNEKLYTLVENYNSTKFKEIAYSERLASRYYSHGHDSWIFTAPIRNFMSEILIGTIGCEKIGYYAYLSGMRVSNPAITLKSYHLHTSDIRTYDRNVFVYFPPYLHEK